MTSTISMVMIAKNEADSIDRCFSSWWDAVDEVVLCDTGSRDGTIREARRFARERGEPDKLVVGRFRWCDDFSAARNYASSLASGDWHAYVDADDRIEGAKNLRSLAADASPDTVVFTAPYAYIVDWPFPIQWMWLPRLWRPEAGRWVYRTYELWRPWDATKLGEGTLEVKWIHGRRSWASSERRERRIVRRWAIEEPDHPMQLVASALCARRDGDAARAEELLRKVLALRLNRTDRDKRPVWAHAAVTLAEMLLARGADAEARKLARSAANVYERLGGQNKVAARGWLVVAKVEDRARRYPQALAAARSGIKAGEPGELVLLELQDLEKQLAVLCEDPVAAELIARVRRAMDAQPASERVLSPAR
jgi:hypothetical protein